MKRTKQDLSVPVGYRFHPTEEELLNHYLKNKIHGGNDSEINQIIAEIDLCKYEPTDLPALLGSEPEAEDMEWFFFTRNAYKYNNSCRSNRSTNKGFWKITGKEREIKARRSKDVIGKKRTLTYYRGRVPKSKKTNWVIHEYYFPGNEVISHQKQAKGDYVICRLKNKSGKRDFSGSDEGDPGSTPVSICENQATDEETLGNGEMLIHQPQFLDDCRSLALQSLTSLELEAVLQTNSTSGDCSSLQSPFGDTNSCLLNRNEVSTCDEDETVYDVYPQLRDPPEENLDSLLGPHQPQQHYCPSTLQSPIYTKLGESQHPLHPQVYQPLILQSPIYTKQGNVPDANLYYDECNMLQSAIKKRISTNEVDIPVRHSMSSFEYQATDYIIPEVRHPQTEENLESPVYPVQFQDSTLQQPVYTNLGDALHTTECNELPIGNNDYAFTKYFNTIFTDHGYFSPDQTAQTQFGNSNLPESLGMVYHGDSGVSNDRNTELAHGWAQDSSALATGHTLQCS